MESIIHTSLRLFVSRRRFMISMAIWITPSHQHGTQMAEHSPLETKTKHAGYGTSGISPNQLLYWVAISEPSGQFATLPMGSSWRWQSLQILSTSLMLIVGTAGSRNWISLVRSQAYHSVLTLKLSLSVCMIVHTAATSSSTADDSTRTLTQHWSCCWQGSVSEIQITGCRN